MKLYIAVELTIPFKLMQYSLAAKRWCFHSHAELHFSWIQQLDSLTPQEVEKQGNLSSQVIHSERDKRNFSPKLYISFPKKFIPKIYKWTLKCIWLYEIIDYQIIFCSVILVCAWWIAQQPLNVKLLFLLFLCSMFTVDFVG